MLRSYRAPICAVIRKLLLKDEWAYLRKLLFAAAIGLIRDLIYKSPIRVN